jgi:lipid-A-disaccharide synthase
MALVAIVAGEASGDHLAAGLIRAAHRLHPGLRFAGVAGPAMLEAGCEPWFRTEELSVMGLAEVLRHLPRLARIGRSVRERVMRERPAVFVGVDAPDFNLRVAAHARAAGIPTVQYVCPSVWAWRPKRVEILRRACDQVLCLLPFETPFLAKARVPASFVGHPFADEIPEKTDARPVRISLELGGAPVVALLPGSRMSEVTRLGPLFAVTAAILQRRFARTSFVAPMASDGIGRSFAAALRRHAPACQVRLLSKRAREALAACDVALVASGTATLEAMLIKRPMVVAYQLAPLTYAMTRLLRLVQVPFFSLPNLLAGECLVPEYLQAAATPQQLAEALTRLIESPDDNAALRGSFLEQHRRLRQGASEAAAVAMLRVAGLRS